LIPKLWLEIVVTLVAKIFGGMFIILPLRFKAAWPKPAPTAIDLGASKPPAPANARKWTIGKPR
jgi:hypothetical protein